MWRSRLGISRDVDPQPHINHGRTLPRFWWIKEILEGPWGSGPEWSEPAEAPEDWYTAEPISLTEPPE